MYRRLDYKLDPSLHAPDVLVHPVVRVEVHFEEKLVGGWGCFLKNWGYSVLTSAHLLTNDDEYPEGPIAVTIIASPTSDDPEIRISAFGAAWLESDDRRVDLAVVRLTSRRPECDPVLTCNPWQGAKRFSGAVWHPDAEPVQARRSGPGFELNTLFAHGDSGSPMVAGPGSVVGVYLGLFGETGYVSETTYELLDRIDDEVTRHER